MKKDASRFSPKDVLFHRTFFTAPYTDKKTIPIFQRKPDKQGSPKRNIGIVL